MVDFSLIILCKGATHLLPSTLDTLKGQKGAFEVLLLVLDKGSGAVQLTERYPDLPLRVQDVTGKTLPEMMNDGVALAKGRYIQYLEPGDRYISQHSFEFLSTLIEKKPHLVYANALNRELLTPADFTTARSPWLLKQKVVELGGFDPRLRKCPTLDLLCRLFTDQTTQSVYCRRVFLDAAPDTPISIRETCRILYRHFGLWQALKWVFFQDRSHWFRRTATFFKEAFWGHESEK